jgi:hypothetical protein
MTQAELNHAVSAATGEDVHEICLRGFSLVDSTKDAFDECDLQDPQVIDWDARFAGTTQSFHESL